MKDSYKHTGEFFSVLWRKLSLLTSKQLEYKFILVAGVIGFTSAVLKEYHLNILGRYDLGTGMACANPTPGSVFPIFQVAGNCKIYSQLIPATYYIALFTINGRV